MEHINFKEKKQFEVTYLTFLIALGVLGLLFGSLIVFQTIKIASLEKDITEKEGALASLGALSQKKEDAENSKSATSLSKIMNVVEEKIEWSTYLEILSLVPNRVWLTDLKLTKEKIVINGQYSMTKDVVSFLNKLKEKKMFKELGLRSTQRNIEKDKEETLTFVMEGMVK